jgi:hypothetical protein
LLRKLTRCARNPQRVDAIAARALHVAECINGLGLRHARARRGKPIANTASSTNISAVTKKMG